MSITMVAAPSPSPIPSSLLESPFSVNSSSSASTDAAPGGGSSSSTAATPPAIVQHLQTGEALLLAVLIAITASAIGLILILARTGRLWRKEDGQTTADSTTGTDDDKSIVRAWLAVVLVVGLLVFGSATFAIDDAQLRSTLIGGLVASAGSAIAYYFSSKTADNARRDILGAVFPEVVVPNLATLSIADATSE